MRSRCVSVSCYIGAYLLFICVKRKMWRGQRLETVAEGSSGVPWFEAGRLWATPRPQHPMNRVSFWWPWIWYFFLTSHDTCWRPSLESCLKQFVITRIHANYSFLYICSYKTLVIHNLEAFRGTIRNFVLGISRCV